jgi:hypothetical protein
MLKKVEVISIWIPAGVRDPIDWARHSLIGLHQYYAHNCTHELQVSNGKGYLLVWGKATYRDGFDTTPRRFIKFCHRYPCVDCTGDQEKGYTIGTKNVRFHNFGNEQD